MTRQSCQPAELPRDSVFWQGTASVQDPVICAPTRKHVRRRLVLGTVALSWHSARDTVKRRLFFNTILLYYAAYLD